MKPATVALLLVGLVPVSNVARSAVATRLRMMARRRQRPAGARVT